MDLLFSSNRHLASKPFKSVRIDSRNITFERKLRKKFKASTLTLINFRINRNHRNRFKLFFYFIVYYIFFYRNESKLYSFKWTKLRGV